jgi:hypothetical protein
MLDAIGVQLHCSSSSMGFGFDVSSIASEGGADCGAYERGSGIGTGI